MVCPFLRTNFMPRQLTTEAIHLVTILMKKYREGKDLHMAFIDLEKVYDKDSKEVL